MIHGEKIIIILKNRPVEIDYFLREGGDRSVVYLHGLGCSKEDFAQATTVDGLCDFTLLAFNFPGCGGSAYPGELRLEMGDLVEIAHETVKALLPADPVIIGHSMGGLVGLLYCLRFGESVRGFINVEGNLAAEDCFISCRAAEHGREEFARSIFPALTEEISASGNPGRRKFARALREKTSPEAFFDYSKSLVEASADESLLQAFISLNMPKLYLRGMDSPRPSYLQLLQQSGIEVREIPGSGHFPFHDNPRAYYEAIAGFLAGTGI